MSKTKDNLRVEKENSKRRNPWRSDAEKSCAKEGRTIKACGRRRKSYSAGNVETC